MRAPVPNSGFGRGGADPERRGRVGAGLVGAEAAGEAGAAAITSRASSSTRRG